MVICVHSNINKKNGLLIVKISGYTLLNNCFFFRTRKNTPAIVNF